MGEGTRLYSCGRAFGPLDGTLAAYGLAVRNGKGARGKKEAFLLPLNATRDTSHGGSLPCAVTLEVDYCCSHQVIVGQDRPRSCLVFPEVLGTDGVGMYLVRAYC